MKRQFLALFVAFVLIYTQFFFVAPPARAAGLFYVDFATGLNSNNGTSTSTPWKSAPGMNTASACGGATHSYSPVPGDHFNFKGGVTWPKDCFPFNITNSGTSGSPMYWGVDLSYFTGGSFTRPIFDMANTTSSAGAM